MRPRHNDLMPSSSMNMHCCAMPEPLRVRPPGLICPPLALALVDGLTPTPKSTPNPPPYGEKELPPPVRNGVDGDGNNDAPWLAAVAAAAYCRVLTREAGREGRELTVDGA